MARRRGVTLEQLKAAGLAADRGLRTGRPVEEEMLVPDGEAAPFSGGGAAGADETPPFFQPEQPEAPIRGLTQKSAQRMADIQFEKAVAAQQAKQAAAEARFKAESEKFAALPTTGEGDKKFYDLEKIAADDNLSKLFAEATGSRQAVDDYKAVKSLPVIEQDGEKYYDIKKIAADDHLSGVFKSFVPDGEKFISDFMSSTASSRLAPAPPSGRGLPEGLSQSDYDALRTQEAETARMRSELYAQQDAARKELRAFTDRITEITQKEGAHQYTPEEQAESDRLEGRLATLNAQSQTAEGQYQALSGTVRYIDAYKSGEAETFNLKAEDVKKLQKQADPSIVKFVTAAPDATKSTASGASGPATFDLVAAVAAGISEAKLKDMGIGDEAVSAAKDFLKGLEDEKQSIAEGTYLSKTLDEVLPLPRRPETFEEGELSPTEQRRAELEAIYSDKGVDAFKQAVADLGAERLKSFESSLQAADPKLYKVYSEQGYEAYSKAYEETLAQFKVVDDWMAKAGAVKNGEYDLLKAVNYLYNQPKVDQAMKANLEAAFGADTIDKYYRLRLSTGVTIGPAGGKQAMSNEEYAEMIRPPNLSSDEWSKIKPFITTRDIDLYGAIKQGVSPDVVKKFAGLNPDELKDLQFQVKYEEQGWAGKLGMAIGKDPAAAAKEMGLAMIPIYGTARNWEDSPGWANALSIVGDVLFIVPVVGQVGALVKGGSALGSAVLRSSLTAVRDTIVSPYTLLRHPVASAKSLLTLPEQLLKGKALPLAITWRGSYENMDITKALAGMTAEQQLATRNAMEEIIRRVTAGEKDVSVAVEGMGVLDYKGSGLQKVMQNYVGTSTPQGPEFKGVGLEVNKDGLFMSPEHYLGLSYATATGKSPLYVLNNGEVIGVIDGTGKVLNPKGVQIGTIAADTKIMSLKGKDLGYLTTDGRILDRQGELGREVAYMKDGAVKSADPAVIGKVYAGQPFIKEGKVLGTFAKDGSVVMDGKAVDVGKLEMIVGFIPEGAKAVGEGGVVIGKGVAQPTFAMVKTEGVTELPAWVKSAPNMAEMEKRAWEAFKGSDAAGKLFPVFKQFARWIEMEAVLPAGSKLIPLIGSDGKPVMYFTRDLSGKRIEIPLMQVASKDWFEKSLAVTKAIAEKPLPQPRTAEGMLFDVASIPAESRTALVAWLRNNDAAVIGSAAEVMWTRAGRSGAGIIAKDIDIAVKDTGKALDELTDLFKNTSKLPIRNDGKKAIEMLVKGRWVKVADIDPWDWASKVGTKYGPTKELDLVTVDGIRVQTPRSQAAALLERMEGEFGGKGFARFERFTRAMGEPVDLGIGAKPPTWAGVAELKARGVYNTFRDIFIRGLSQYDTLPVEVLAAGKAAKAGKVTEADRLKLIDDLAPDLGTEARALMRLERQVIDAHRSIRTATKAAVRAGLAAAGTAAAKKPDEVVDLERRYAAARDSLIDRLASRLAIVAPEVRRMPERPTDADRERLLKSIEEAYRSPREIATDRVGLERPTRIDDLRAAHERRVPRVGEDRSSRVPRAPEELRTPRDGERGTRPPVEGRLPRGIRPPEGRLPRMPRVPEEPRVPRPPEERIPRTPRERFEPPLKRLNVRLPDKELGEKSRREQFEGALTWKQGFGWWAAKEPYSKPEDFEFFNEPPPGATYAENMKSAYETIQQLTGKPPERKLLDMGIMDITVSSPQGQAGVAGAIGFQLDATQTTQQEVDLRKQAPMAESHLRRGPEHTSDISLRRTPHDTKLGHAGTEIDLERKAKGSAPTVPTVKIRARATPRTEGRNTSRNTRSLVRVVITPKTSPEVRQKYKLGTGIGMTISEGNKNSALGKFKGNKSRRVPSNAAPVDASLSRVGKIYVKTDLTTGDRQLSRRPFKRSTKSKGRRRR